MWKHKISTATLGGHGLGASFALKAAIEHYDRTSGFFAIDYAPVDYTKYKVFQDLKNTLNHLNTINLAGDKESVFKGINKATHDEKWRKIFQQSLV
jgi:pimeloyl-ACP methyl ester carboxylesterase